MAFLGFGYGKKDYEKNTRLFIDQINGLMEENYESGMGTGALLDTAIRLLEKNKFPEGKNSKEQKAVDERISRIIASMSDDVQQSSQSAFASHAQMLISAIKESRKFGKERYNEKEIHAQEEMAKCRAHIHNALDEKEKLAARKEKLLKIASSGTKSDAEIAKIRMEFNELDKAEKACDKQVAMFQSRYNTFVDVVNQRKIGGAVEKLENTSIVSLEEYTKEVAETNLKIAEQAEIDSGFDEVTKDANEAFNDSYSNKESDSSFDVLLENKKNEMANSAINGSSFAPSGAQADDPFLSAMNKLNN